MKITTFNDRPVRHVRYMPDGTVILNLYERRQTSLDDQIVICRQFLGQNLPKGWTASPRASPGQHVPFS